MLDGQLSEEYFYQKLEKLIIRFQVTIGNVGDVFYWDTAYTTTAAITIVSAADIMSLVHCMTIYIKT